MPRTERERQYQRLWREKNKEKVRQYRKEEHARNKEAYQERYRQWIADHPEYTREWRAKNPDKVSQYNQTRHQVRKGTPEYRLMMKEVSLRYKARKRNATIIEPVDVAAIWLRDKGRCQLCGKPIRTDVYPNHREYATLDHIVPLYVGGIHAERNLQLAHRGCNARKGAVGRMPSQTRLC